MAFKERMTTALEHEIEVARAITGYGYHVKPFGQGQLDEATRNKLKDHETPLRWLPDLLAINNSDVYLVDAKTGRMDTPNYIIESASLDTLAALEEALAVPTLIVWADMKVTRATRLKASTRLQRRTGTRTGSGTDFYRHPKQGASVDLFYAFLIGEIEVPS